MDYNPPSKRTTKLRSPAILTNMQQRTYRPESTPRDSVAQEGKISSIRVAQNHVPFNSRSSTNENQGLEVSSPMAYFVKLEDSDSKKAHSTRLGERLVQQSANAGHQHQYPERETGVFDESIIHHMSDEGSFLDSEIQPKADKFEVNFHQEAAHRAPALSRSSSNVSKSFIDRETSKMLMDMNTGRLVPIITEKVGEESNEQANTCKFTSHMALDVQNYQIPYLKLLDSLHETSKLNPVNHSPFQVHPNHQSYHLHQKVSNPLNATLLSTKQHQSHQPYYQQIPKDPSIDNHQVSHKITLGPDPVPIRRKPSNFDMMSQSDLNSVHSNQGFARDDDYQHMKGHETTNERELRNFVKYQNLSDHNIDSSSKQQSRPDVSVPLYRSVKSVEKLSHTHEMFMSQLPRLDPIQTERSQRFQTRTFRSNSNESSEEKIKPKNRKIHLSTKADSRSDPNTSILENAEEATTLELFVRVVAGYGQNISNSFRRLLLNLGSKVDRQREAEQRRKKAFSESILDRSSNKVLLDAEAEISSIDKQNMVQVMIILALVLLVILLLRK